MTTISQRMKAAHASNYVHHPQGFMVFRHNGKWAASMIRKDTDTISSITPEYFGDTPEDAMESLWLAIDRKAIEYVNRLVRDADNAREELAYVTEAKP